MTVFTVHMKQGDPASDVLLIKDGFSVWAAVFSFVWALWVGAWELALALVVFQGVMGVVLPMMIVDLASLAVVQVGLAVLMGVVANDARRLFLKFRSLEEIGVVTGLDKVDAERRFLDTHPDITAQLLERS